MEVTASTQRKESCYGMEVVKAGPALVVYHPELSPTVRCAAWDPWSRTAGGSTLSKASPGYGEKEMILSRQHAAMASVIS